MITAVAAIAGASGCGTSGPAWCGPVTAQLTNGQQTVQRQLHDLAAYSGQPLVAAYIRDTHRFQAADALWRYYMNQVVSPEAVHALHAANRAGKKWAADKKAILARCNS
jgi:hypothetical protein